MIRIMLPAPLCELAKLEGELELEEPVPATFNAMIDKLENLYPALKGKIRDAQTHKRRPMVRIFACEQDYSQHSLETTLPDDVRLGKAAVIIVGAIAGG